MIQNNIFWTSKNGAGLRLHPNRLQRAIVLYGAKGVGKTKTLNRLIDRLVAIGSSEANGGVLYEEVMREHTIQTLKDRCVLVRAFGKLVCVMTGGDNGVIVKKGIELAFRYNADILVSATRRKTNSDSWTAFWNNLVVHGIPYVAFEKVGHARGKNGPMHAEDITEFLVSVIQTT